MESHSRSSLLRELTEINAKIMVLTQRSLQIAKELTQDPSANKPGNAEFPTAETNDSNVQSGTRSKVEVEVAYHQAESVESQSDLSEVESPRNPRRNLCRHSSFEEDPQPKAQRRHSIFDEPREERRGSSSEEVSINVPANVLTNWAIRPFGYRNKRKRVKECKFLILYFSFIHSYSFLFIL
jgi:hypothetical protein